MHNLLNFLIKNSFWFLFIFLEIVSFYFIFSGNSYQRSAFFNYSNEVSGNVYSVGSSITSYFGLKEENESLLQKNGELLNKITALENYIFELEKDSIKTRAFLDSKFSANNEYVVARVINNSISQSHNYITINKGANDGIDVGMGVVSQRGIVGEVRAVSNNFSLIQSLLNPDSKYSSKLLESSVFGPIEWDGENPRYVMMKDYPGHEVIVVGDTVVTSGYSDIFPGNIMVGTVHSFEMQKNKNQYQLTIELSTDFTSLSNVLVVKRNWLKEKQELENSVK